MGKGKKFDAAEKHFKEKETRLRKELWALVSESQRRAETAEAENVRLTKKIEELQVIKEKYDKLIEYSMLTEEDLVKAVEKDKNLAELAGVMRIMSRFCHI